MKTNLTKITFRLDSQNVVITVNEKGRILASNDGRETMWKRWMVSNKKVKRGCFLKLKNGDAEMELEHKVTDVEILNTNKDVKHTKG